MTFSEALYHVKHHRAVARKGWNGENQHIELAEKITFINRHGHRVFAFHDDVGSMAIAFVGTSGIQVGWLASQSDMLADDWFLVD